MTEPIKGLHINSGSVSTFQSLDGSNFTTAGINICHEKIKVLSLYAGVGTNFQKNTTGAIIDLKASYPYAQIELANGKNITFKAGGRIRNNINPSSQTIQVKVEPATINIPLNDKVSFYATPYILTKSAYQEISAENLSNNLKMGAFAGFSIGKFSIEWQEYDFKNLADASVNVIAKV